MPANDTKLSTFYGVFTPSILTILGVVLFLRTGWVVGNVGLIPALGIVALAHVITIATAFSVSAIATNMQVGAGGAYFMISRSLGLEIGGDYEFFARPADIADECFHVAHQPRSTWTFDAVIRPYGEAW